MTPALLFIVLLLLAGCFLLFLRGDIFFGISQGAGHWFRPKRGAKRPQWPAKPPIATLLGCELIYVRRASPKSEWERPASANAACDRRFRSSLECCAMSDAHQRDGTLTTTKIDLVRRANVGTADSLGSSRWACAVEF